MDRIEMALIVAIKEQKKKQGFTNNELAKKLNISERTVLRMLNGESDINVSQLARIAAVFNMYPHQLLRQGEEELQKQVLEDMSDEIK